MFMFMFRAILGVAVDSSVRSIVVCRVPYYWCTRKPTLSWSMGLILSYYPLESQPYHGLWA